ncbi:MAG: SDR family NAD(P)-dependent oxidoreductase [Bacteroidetes bacterium]|nr:SDR family NAD(P)-dependent oxidoreductase [Bacteroidota bacterium]
MLVFITGATSGIGKSTAELFAKHGHDLILTGRRADRLNNLKAELQNKYSVKVTVLCFDIRQSIEVENALHSLNLENNKIDLLVNNAGLAAGLSSLQEGKLDHWERMIDTNVKGLLYVSKIVANIMIQQKSGHIINIGSIAGKEVYANGNVYCATKHAVDALTKGMRIDLLQHNIKVTAINPGMVETEFSIVRFDGDEERAKKVYNGMQPLKPEDIAETVFWAANRPAHVNINDIIIMPTVQASATNVIRNTGA